MPITQERMLALITAGQDYQQGLQKACDLVRLANEQVIAGSDPELEIRRLAALIYESGLLKQPLTSHTLLATEAQHYHKEHFRNAKRAEWLRASRKAQGKAPAPHTAPKSLQRQIQISGEPQTAQIEKTLQGANLQAILKHEFKTLSPEDQAGIMREAELAAQAEGYAESYREKTQTKATVESKAEEPEPTVDIEIEIDDSTD